MKTRRIAAGWIFAGCLLAAMPGRAAFDPTTWPVDKELPTREAHVETLPNGLTFVVEQWDQGDNKDRAHVVVLVQTGSLYEEPGQAGYAHFIEHVLFRGSKGQSAKKTERFMKQMGVPVALHGQGGSTTLDRTMYSLPLPETPDKHLPRALAILAARVSRPLFRAADVEAERDIVLAEEQQRRASDAGRARQVAAYGKTHPLVTRNPIGSRESLGDASVDGLKAFFERWYRPDRMIVVVVGDVDVTRAGKAVRKTFGSIPASRDPALPLERVGPPAGRHAEIIVDPKIEVRAMGLSFMRDYVRTDTLREFERRTAAVLAANIVRNRLRDFRDTTPFITSVRLQTDIRLDIQTEQISVVADDDRELEAFARVLSIVQGVIEQGFTQAEIATGKSLLEQGYNAAEERRYRAPAVAIARNWLNELHLGAHPTSLDGYLGASRRALSRITAEDVRIEFSRQFDAIRRNLIISVPEGESLAAALSEFEAVAAFFDDVPAPLAKAATRPADGDPVIVDAADDPFLLQGLRKAAVIAERKYADIDTTQWTLDNGVQVLFKRDPQPNTPVVIQFRTPGGLSLLPDYDLVRVQLAREVIIASGLRGLKSSALGNLFRLHRTTTSVFLSETEHGFTVNTVPDQLDFAFRALHVVAREGQVDDDAFESVVAKSRNRLSATLANPQFQFAAARSEVLFPGAKLNIATMSTASLDAASPDWVRQLYSTLYAHASGTWVLISGPLEAESVKSKVLSYIGSLPDGPVRRPGNVEYPIASDPGVVRQQSNPDDRSVGALFFLEANPGFDDREVLVRTAYASLLTDNLIKEIREKRALVYSISAQAQSPDYPKPHGMIVVSFVADPANVAEIERAVIDIVDEMAEAVSKRGLVPLRKMMLRGFEKSLEKPAYVLSTLYSHLLQGKTLPTTAEYRALIGSVDVEALRTYAEKVSGKFVQVRTEFAPAASKGGESSE